MIVTDSEKIRHCLSRIEDLLQQMDKDDLRPALMWQILACGPLHLDSMPPFLIDLEVEMDRHDRKFAFRTGHCPPKFSDERILTRAAHIILLHYIEHHDGWLDEAIEAIDNKENDVMPVSRAIEQAKNQAPITVKLYASSENYLATKFRKDPDKYLLPAAERIFDEECPVKHVLPLY